MPEFDALRFPRAPRVANPDTAPRSRGALALAGQDESLVERVRDGDKQALAVIFDTYYEALCAFVEMYVGRAAVAEEIVQDLFFRIWVQRQDWKVRGTIEHYLYGAARNRALGVLRHERVADRWSLNTSADAAFTGHSETADEPMRARELAEAVRRAVAALPPRRRQAYTLRWQHDLSLSEIAEAMGVSIKCVELQLTKATRTVHAAIESLLR